MDAKFWKEKWEIGDTKFHREAPHPQLVANFSNLEPRKVMVPLCGKTKDLYWLRQQGHTVAGIELSTIACEAFFEENELPFTKQSLKAGIVFKGDGIALWCTDFFEVPSEAWEGCTAVYDRAALVALPAETRRKYAEHLVPKRTGDPDVAHYVRILLGRKLGAPFSRSRKRSQRALRRELRHSVRKL